VRLIITQFSFHKYERRTRLGKVSKIAIMQRNH